MKTLALTPSVQIPVIGFGTWQLLGDEAQQAVEMALELGYRHIDTADRYENHRQVGSAIQKSGVRRSDLFLTTKVWFDELRYQEVLDSVARFQDELQTEYFDLVLIHWPSPDVPIRETLDALRQLQQQGVIRSIGVSNFTIAHLQEALATGVDIVMNQVEFHPSLNQKKLKQFCDEHNIYLTAYSPIAQGKDIELELVQSLAVKYGRSPAQVILNWLIQKNIVVIPRSTKRERISDSLAAADWQLEQSDMELMEQLHSGNRLITKEWIHFDD